MRGMRLGKIVFGILLFSVFVLEPRAGMALEEAKYAVLEREGDFELRQYEPHIVAETLVESNFEDAGNEGFRRLYDYISGKNRKQQTIPMTAPVSQEASSEKIPMTKPVTQEQVGGKWRITFLMPYQYTLPSSEKIPMTKPVTQEQVGGKWRITFLMPYQYTLENLPEPPKVHLTKVPGLLRAALSYSGTWSKGRYEDKEKRLKELIRQRGLKIVGEPVFARYNPPFMPWFLRRNEVLIPVTN
jgi:hypothetical protein